MPTQTKTSMLKTEEVSHQWYLVDGDGQVVGRLASKLAMVLMGKHKAAYTPHVDCGDFVVVVNADKVRFTGQPIAHPRHPYFTDKMLEKMYEKYTGYPSGRRLTSAANVWERHPERILQEAVRRMLPKNKLASKMLKRLKLYAGPNHPHQAQEPVDLPEHLRP
jgi:large subunit ribosomal protein L13